MTMKTILVVDDNKNHLLLYEHELSLEGYTVITAMDGHEAVKKIKEYSPDLVITDIVLFKINGNGIELIGNILRECKHMDKNIPIIINTAYSSCKDNFVAWLTDAYILKSSDLSELKNKIKELLS